MQVLTTESHGQHRGEKMRHKQKIPKRNNKKYKKYTKEALLNAYRAVTQNRMPVQRAARQFNVPEQTLRDRVKGKVDAEHLHLGADNLFSQEQEESLVEHVETMAQLGYGLTNTKLQHLAGELALNLKLRNTDRPLSNSWLYNFLGRWRHRLTSLKPRGLDSNRAKNTTPEIVQSYFQNLHEIMNKYGLMDKPQYIYNVDETGIQPEHRPPNVIAPIGSKPQAVTSPQSTTTTVIGCANAAGNHLPPFFVFKGKRYSEDLMKGSSVGAQGVMSDSGWSNAHVFQQYVQNHFIPNVRRGSNDNQHILLILDGHSSHISRNLISWAMEHHIILFVLPAHTSHLLQPLDVSIFGPFKAFYYRECASYMRSFIGMTVTRYDMCSLACRAYLKAMTPINITSGFRKTGIFPFSREVIAEEKLYPSESFREEKPLEKVIALKTGKESVQEFLLMKSEKIEKPCCKCNCSIKLKTVNLDSHSIQKPKPGGAAITEDEYITSLDKFNNSKSNPVPKKVNKKTIPESPKPSTSGLHLTTILQDSDSSLESDNEDDSGACCVCGRFSPPDLHKKPYLKIVNWAQCDGCGHWVHLSFCTEQTVIRRNSSFFCHHCTSD